MPALSEVLRENEDWKALWKLVSHILEAAETTKDARLMVIGRQLAHYLMRLSSVKLP